MKHLLPTLLATAGLLLSSGPAQAQANPSSSGHVEALRFCQALKEVTARIQANSNELVRAQEEGRSPRLELSLPGFSGWSSEYSSLNGHYRISFISIRKLEKPQADAIQLKMAKTVEECLPDYAADLNKVGNVFGLPIIRTAPIHQAPVYPRVSWETGYSIRTPREGKLVFAISGMTDDGLRLQKACPDEKTEIECLKTKELEMSFGLW